jgi:isocitrate dehydrogenase
MSTDVPITVAHGGGFKSLNVTARKMLGLYANIRPCVACHPFMTETLRSYDGAAGYTLSRGQ